MKRYLYIAVIAIATMFFTVIEKRVVKEIEINNLEVGVICIEEELDSSYITAMVHTINVYNELDRFNFDFTVREDCSEGYKYTVVNTDLAGKTRGQTRTSKDYKGRVVSVEIKFDNDIEMPLNKKIHIALHEFGHLVGVKHIEDEDAKGVTVMYYSTIDKPLLTLTDDDMIMLNRNLTWEKYKELKEDFNNE